MNAHQVNTMSADNEEQALAALVEQLVVIAEKAPTHRLMLIALLSVFKAVAITHPCCTHDAAKTALNTGGELLVRAIGNSAPPGPIH